MDVSITVVMSLVTPIWFSWGGVCDIIQLFVRLKTEKINTLDDGTVVSHQTLDEASLRE